MSRGRLQYQSDDLMLRCQIVHLKLKPTLTTARGGAWSRKGLMSITVFNTGRTELMLSRDLSAMTGCKANFRLDVTPGSTEKINVFVLSWFVPDTFDPSSAAQADVT